MLGQLAPANDGFGVCLRVRYATLARPWRLGQGSAGDPDHRSLSLARWLATAR